MVVVSDFTLRGRSALVTSSTRGIGRTIALRLARAGATIAVNAQSRADCGPLVEEIEGFGGVAIPVPGAIETTAGCEAIWRASMDQLGVVDILVNSGTTDGHLALRGEDREVSGGSVSGIRIRSVTLPRYCSPGRGRAARASLPRRGSRLLARGDSGGRGPCPPRCPSGPGAALGVSNGNLDDVDPVCVSHSKRLNDRGIIAEMMSRADCERHPASAVATPPAGAQR